MSRTSLEALLKRDRRIVVGAVALLTLLAWVYLIWLTRNMAMATTPIPGMPGMHVSAAVKPMLRVWTAVDFTFTFLMWTIMMVGMMTPSAAPMILIYARVARESARERRPLAATGWFVGGYLLCWTAFSIVAALAQGALARAAWLNPMMAAANSKAGGAVLIVAGLYQFTPLKNSCLSRCHSPFAFLQTNGGLKQGMAASIKLGLKHGMYCVGCCWALMTLLFVGGVMNILWIAAIAVHILIEKVLHAGPVIARIAGAGLVVAGLWLLLK